MAPHEERAWTHTCMDGTNQGQRMRGKKGLKALKAAASYVGEQRASEAGIKSHRMGLVCMRAAGVGGDCYVLRVHVHTWIHAHTGFSQ